MPDQSTDQLGVRKILGIDFEYSSSVMYIIFKHFLLPENTELILYISFYIKKIITKNTVKFFEFKLLFIKLTITVNTRVRYDVHCVFKKL